MTVISLKIEGGFDTKNNALISSLDRASKTRFVADLQSKHGEPELVGKAVLARGYLRFICSAIEPSERVQTFGEGVVMRNSHDGYSLGAHLKYLLVSRLGELIQELLDAFRLEDPQQQ